MEQGVSAVKSNIWKLSVIQSLKWFMIAMPIIVLFYMDNGLSMSQILILQAIFSIVIVVTEVPSGYFSDIVGRKHSIVLGVICGFLGYLVYSFSFGFVGFLIAEIILGFGASFISGADSAMLYDSLLDMGKETDYKRLEGRLTAIGGWSEGLAAILGGFTAVVSLRFPVYLETAIIFLAIPFAFSLVEPKRKSFTPTPESLGFLPNGWFSWSERRPPKGRRSFPEVPESVMDNAEGNWRAIVRIVKFSLHEQLEIKWLIIYGALLGSSTLLMTWFIQPILKQAGLPLVLFGAVWAVFNLFLGFFSYSAHWVEKFFGRKRSLVLMILLNTIGYLALAFFGKYLWAVVFILIFYFVRGINIPIIKDYLNRLVASDIRATVLSVRALAARLIFAVLGPFIGWINDLYSLSVALSLAGFLFAFFGTISLLFLRKHKAL